MVYYWEYSIKLNASVGGLKIHIFALRNKWMHPWHIEEYIYMLEVVVTAFVIIFKFHNRTIFSSFLLFIWTISCICININSQIKERIIKVLYTYQHVFYEHRNIIKKWSELFICLQKSEYVAYSNVQTCICMRERKKQVY